MISTSNRVGRSALVAAAGLLLLSLLGAAIPAIAQSDDLNVAVRDSSFEPDGSTDIIVNVTGSARPDVLEGEAFSVTENGDAISGLQVEPVLESTQVDLAVVLALDVSGSMAGEPLESMKAAATETITTLTEQGVAVGLVTFAVEVEVLSEPTLDTGSLTGLVDALEADGGTALHDAVIEGVAQLADSGAVNTLVVFADGGDNESAATLDEAIGVAAEAAVPVTVVAFETEDFNPDSLRPLADETAGGFFTPAEPVDFSAVLADVAEDVASQYVLSYSSGRYETDELDIGVSVAAGGSEAQAQFVVANVREEFAIGTAAPPPAAEVFDAGVFGRPGVLLAALGIAFLAVVLVLLLLFYPRGDRAASQTLRRGVTMVQRGESDGRLEGGTYASSIAQSAIGLVSRAPKPEGYDERLQNDIDRAGWNLRAGEFTTLRVVGALLGLVLLWALTGSLLVGIVAAVLVGFVPRLLLTNARSRRQARFMAQLPDTLQLLAGTLKAGYGVLQAIDTVVKEVDDPMASEFQRALTEARLGLPLEDSLNSMADRVGTDDFRWVVVAMNIQRQVGGNLAELLETVAETLRGREQV
ncbi:MAG: VWA domain-containing protein, partial [Nitriliruptoraceae bacterium]